ncbi:hypothetical protein EDB19DRAFT_1748873 [Suillus lakei]|nr:hypothetical protein EDB19DRAFT_1748873 [Suillus lakei]
MRTANSQANIPSVSYVIDAMQNILARSRVIVCLFQHIGRPGHVIDHDQIPDLETPYSRFPNTDQSAMREGQSISAITTERQQQLDSVLHEISGLEAIMDMIKCLHQKLVEKQTKITQSMILHKGVVSALWRLPTEVLSQIFYHCLPEFGHLSPPSGLKAPMLLTGICRRWREVAVNMSSLWCGLFVRVDGRDWQRAASCCDSWLKQSRGRPLSLRLQCRANDDSTKLQILLQPYINHITSLFIQFPSASDAPQSEHLLKDLPALRQLTIAAADEIAIARSISRLPNTLRGLRVLGTVFDVEHLFPPSPVWAHLTDVEIAIRGPFLLLLQLCPNLASLTVHSAFLPPSLLFGGMGALEPFTHTKLQSLRIPQVIDRNELSGVFEALSLPNLRVLEVCDVGAWPHNEFKAFLARSNCPLRHLILTTTDEQRAEYMALIPSLTIVANPRRA